MQSVQRTNYHTLLLPVSCCDTNIHPQKPMCWENSMVTTPGCTCICSPVAPGDHKTRSPRWLWVQYAVRNHRCIISTLYYLHCMSMPVRVSWVDKNQCWKLIRPSWKQVSSLQAIWNTPDICTNINNNIYIYIFLFINIHISHGSQSDTSNIISSAVK